MSVSLCLDTQIIVKIDCVIWILLDGEQYAAQ